MKRLACGTVCTLAVLAGGAATAAAACTDTWTGAVSNQWGTGGNWSNGSSPGGSNPAENVCLPSGAPNYPVILTDFTYSIPNVGLGTAHGAQINDLDIGPGAGVIVEGVGFEDHGDAYHEVDLTVDGRATIEQGGMLEETSTDSGSTADIDNGNGGFASVTGHGSITDDGGLVATSSTTQSTQFHDQLQLPLTVDSDGTVTVTHDPSVPSGNLDITGGQQVTNNGTISISPGANVDINANPFLTGNESFTNSGTVAPQIAAGETGTLTLDHNLNATLGGSVAPQLVGGYVPAAGTEVQAFPVKGATITGTFAAVGGGFAADYSHVTGNAPNYIGLVYQPAVSNGPPPWSGGTAAKAPTVGRPTVKGTIVKLKLSCAAGAACKKTTITETVTETVKRKGKKGKPKTKQVVVGTASATLAAGTSKRVSIRLNKTGRSLLAKAKGHHLKATVKVAVGGKVTKRSKLTLSATRAKHRKGTTHKAKHKS